MSDRELERLLWERIDGTIEAADVARLRQLLASEPGADRLEAEITELAGRLDAAGELPVPADLGDDIRRALAAERTGPAAAPASEKEITPWFGGFGRWMGPQPARRMVYLAAGLMVAAVGYQLVTNQAGPDNGPFVGTAGLTDGDSVTRPVRLELPDARGVLTITPRASGLALELETEPTLGPARLVLQGAGLAVERAGQRGGATFQILSAEPGGLDLEVAGAGGVDLVVSATPGREVTILVQAGSDTLVRHQLAVEAKPTG